MRDRERGREKYADEVCLCRDARTRGASDIVFFFFRRGISMVQEEGTVS